MDDYKIKYKSPDGKWHSWIRSGEDMEDMLRQAKEDVIQKHGKLGSIAIYDLKQSSEYKHLPSPHLDIGERWCDSFLVTFSTSVRYNGGTIIDGKWYEGYKVEPPRVPEGFELIGIGIGLQLMAHPPYATQYLKPIDPDRRVTKKELKAILANMPDNS